MSISKTTTPITRMRLLAASLFASTLAGTLPAQNWNQTAAGSYNWTDNANWGDGTGVHPDATGASATLNTTLAGNQTIALGANITLGSLTLGTASGTSIYTIATAASKLTFDNGASEATFTHLGTGAADALTGNIGITSGGLRIINKGASTLSKMTATITGAGNLTLDGNVSLGGAINNTGTLTLTRIDGNTGTNFLTSPIGANVTSLIVNYSTATDVVAISGNNAAFAGTVDIKKGTLRVTGATALNAKTEVLMTNDADSIMDIQTGLVTIAGLSGEGLIRTGGSENRTLTLAGSGNYSFAINNSFKISDSDTRPLALNVALGSTGTQTITGTERWLARGGVTVSGGSLILANSQVFVGSNYSLGTLLIDGGTLATTVSNTNIAYGNGTSMQLTLQQGTLDLNHADIGTITLGHNSAASNFTMNGGTWKVTVNGANSDKILGKTSATFAITGGIIDFGGTLTESDYSLTYQLLSGFGSGAASGLSIDGYDKTKWTAIYNASNGNLSINFTLNQIPEPSTYAFLLAIAGLAGAIMIRRR